MTNHLVIGLGGTGGAILRALRKTVYQSFRQDDPPNVQLRYLYVDTSDEIMGPNNHTWKILGANVQLKQASQLLIKGLNIAAVLESVQDYPGISPWLGDRSLFRTLVNSADSAKIFGGQKRRLGRFLFACKAAEYVNQTQTLVREMQTGGNVETVFHVCCGLAGGTGAGAIVDAVAQIRRAYPGNQYRILIYALLPEKDPKQNRAQANYHANGYAALMELNALALGEYAPFDVTGAEPGRLQLQDPFNACYLFSDENEAGRRIDLEGEVPNLAASFLYQKIVAARNFAWDGIRRQEAFENLDRSPETSPSGAKAERARIFFAFGIKQIAYPEEEIREYLTYAFARQATLQLRFNNWTDSLGYIEEAKNQSFEAFVKQKETLERWSISDEHVCLSCGILPDEKTNRRWKPITEYWNTLLPNLKTYVRETFAKSEAAWLDELSKKCEATFVENYRELGVQKFYETKRGDRKDQVREIRRCIETELFEDWKTGNRSVHDIARLADSLAKDLQERAASMDDKAAAFKDRIAEIENTMSLNKKEWAKVSWLSERLGKRENLFNAQADNLAQFYIYRTRIHAAGYAKTLLQALCSEVQNMGADISQCATMIADATTEFNRQMRQRCADEGQSEVANLVVRFYQPEAIKAFEKRLTTDQSEQSNQANAVRTAIAARLGDDQRFKTLNDRIHKELLLDLISETCQKSAVESHNALISQDAGLSRILNVNVIERLHRAYSGNPEGLASYVLEVVQNATTYLPFSPAEQARTGPGLGSAARRPVESFSVILPEAKEHAEFRSRLAGEFRNARHGETAIIDNPARPNEITLVTILNLFPVRFIRDLEFLRRRYEARLKEPGAALELHSEGDGSQFPPLFTRTITSKEMFPLVLMAKAMGLIRSLEDTRSGEESLCLVTKDERGRLQETELGSSLQEIVERANAQLFDALDMAVTKLLESEYQHKTKRETLLSAIDAEVAGVARQANGNPRDERYKTTREAAEKAETMIAGRR